MSPPLQQLTDGSSCQDGRFTSSVAQCSTRLIETSAVRINLPLLPCPGAPRRIKLFPPHRPRKEHGQKQRKNKRTSPSSNSSAKDTQKARLQTRFKMTSEKETDRKKTPLLLQNLHHVHCKRLLPSPAAQPSSSSGRPCAGADFMVRRLPACQVNET